MPKKCEHKALIYNAKIQDFYCQICKAIIKDPKQLNSMGGAMKSTSKTEDKKKVIPLNKVYDFEYLDAQIKMKLLERMPVCENCGDDGTNAVLDPAHLYDRDIKSLRWNIKNLITLCRVCHTEFTDGGKTKWNKWWQTKYADRIEYLESHSNIVDHIDTVKVLAYIKTL